MKQGIELTEEHARGFGLEPKGPDESDSAFRERISGQLRDMDRMIEAHEALQNARYDDPEGGDVITGLLGAVSQALSGRNYGSTGSRQIGDDLAAGTIVRHNMSPEGRAQQAADRMMAEMLLGGMSPDVLGDLLGRK